MSGSASTVAAPASSAEDEEPILILPANLKKVSQAEDVFFNFFPPTSSSDSPPSFPLSASTNTASASTSVVAVGSSTTPSFMDVSAVPPFQHQTARMAHHRQQTQQMYFSTPAVPFKAVSLEQTQLVFVDNHVLNLPPPPSHNYIFAAGDGERQGLDRDENEEIDEALLHALSLKAERWLVLALEQLFYNFANTPPP